MRSPSSTPRRRTILPLGTVPMAVTDSESAPALFTVSPPIKGQAKADTSSPRPLAKAFNHSAVQSSGKARPRRKPSGSAAFAARSERLTRKALRATRSGGSWAKKCTPAMILSVVTTRSRSGGGATKAASSLRPRPAAPASGAKNVAMISSSEGRDVGFTTRISISPSLFCFEFRGTIMPRQCIKYGIDHARFFVRKKSTRYINIFFDDDARRNIFAPHQLISAGTQDRAHHRVDARQRPALFESLVDRSIDRALIFKNAAEHVAKKRDLGVSIVSALDLAADPEFF